MGYWDATDQYLSGHGGHGPICPSCGQEMFAEDDHGRFRCSCSSGVLDVVSGRRIHNTPEIPQVDTSGMSDEKKAKIPPINRLYSTPTAAEDKVLKMAAQGHDCMEDPEYWAAVKALEEERNQEGKLVVPITTDISKIFDKKWTCEDCGMEFFDSAHPNSTQCPYCNGKNIHSEPVVHG